MLLRQGGKKGNGRSLPAFTNNTGDVEPNATSLLQKSQVGRLSSPKDRIEHQNDRIQNMEKTVEHQKTSSRSTNFIFSYDCGTSGECGRP
jgi:hypothetical protein